MRYIRLGSFALLAILMFPLRANGATFTIRPDGTGDFPTIQAGIDAVHDGDVLVLADGTFLGPGNRDLDLRGKAITIRGSDPSTCVIDCGGNEADPHRGFYLHSDEGLDSVIEGLTITGASSVGGVIGSGIYCFLRASPTLRNCVFRGNADGAVTCGNNSSPLIVDCEFIENTNTALLFVTSAIVRDCTFRGNVSDFFGGAIYGGYLVSPTIEGCEFVENRALQGGAIAIGDSGSPIVTNCTFRGNQATLKAGAIWCYDNDNTIVATFLDCRFFGNVASTVGGAFECDTASPRLVNCIFADNRTAFGSGGAIYCDGSFAPSSPSIEHCTLYANAAINGGGLAVAGSVSAVVQNSIIAFGSLGEAVSCAGSGTVTLDCCDIEGNAGGDFTGCIADQLGINGNISQDPMFCDTDGEDFTLFGNSPCAPDHNPECGLIGAAPVGCKPTTVIMSSWGLIKARFQ